MFKVDLPTVVKSLQKQELSKKNESELVQEVRNNMTPGYLDTWQMILMKKGDPKACRIRAIEEGQDLTKPFPLEFSSHPGLAMIMGDNIRQ